MLQNNFIVCLVIFLVLTCVDCDSENVALRKPVVGRGNWHPCAVDGKFRTTFQPYATEFPYYYVDLEGVYNLTSINLFCQDEWSFGNKGINVSFDVHTFGEYMSPCSLQRLYPWDPLAHNLMFRKKRHEIVLHPTKPVRYIIIGSPNRNFPRDLEPVVVGEVQAHGVKIKDAVTPGIPEEAPIPLGYYLETRKKILGNQEKVWVEGSGGYFKLNHAHKDVALGWFDEAVFIAAVRGRARVIAIMGYDLTRKINSDPVYSELKRTMKEWLSPGAPDAKFISVMSEHYAKSDILLIQRSNIYDADVVYEKLIAGENSALIGFPAKDRADITSQLLARLNITFVVRKKKQPTGWLGVNNFPYPCRLTSPAEQLKRFRESYDAFLTEKFDYPIDEELWDTDEVKEEFEKFVTHYEPFMDRFGPCTHRQFQKNDRTTAVILKYNDIMKHQHGKKCFHLPHIYTGPGVVQKTQTPTTVVATVYADLQGNFNPIGVYANAGDGFTWTVLDSNDWNFKNFYLRINAQTDEITQNSGWSRWPFVFTAIPLKRSGKLCSPHGGPVLLQLPRGANITIKLTNVYRYAWLDARNPKSWETVGEEIKKFVGVPWMWVAGDSMGMMLRTADAFIAGPENVISSMRHFDNAVKVIHNYRGSSWERARQEAFVCDVQIDFGYGHSGYPMMGYLPWSASYVNYNSIKRGGEDGFVHEIGHNLQVDEATLKDGWETTNNVYHFVVHEFVLGLDAYRGDDVDQGRWRRSDYIGFGWGYYRYLGKMFGYGLVGNGYQAARAARPGNEDAKTQFWIQKMCTETEYDLVPFHSLWHVPMSEKTREVCAKFPCFFPDDKWTREIPDIVNKTLAEAGKQCTRTNTKKIEFRGNITYGLNQRRPQNIFLRFEE